MTIRDSSGNVLTKTQLQAKTSAYTPPAQVTVNENIFIDYTQANSGAHFENSRRKLFHAGELVTQAVIDALFPTATVATVNPAAGGAAGGTAVTITGTGLAGVTGVTFGGTAATNVKVVDDTKVTCTTPAHSAATVNVVVKDDNADVTVTNGFVYS